MSAAEKIAEELADMFASQEQCWCAECRHGHAAHLIGLIRAMSPAEQAEIIGGHAKTRKGFGQMHANILVLCGGPRSHFRGEDHSKCRPHQMVVVNGPWVEVQP